MKTEDLNSAIETTIEMAENASPELADALRDFIQFRKDIRKPYKTLAGFKGLLSNLTEYSGGNSEQAVKILRQSIANEWQGIFPLKDQASKPKKGSNIPVFD